MDNVTFVDRVDDFSGITVTYAIIAKDDGGFTSMLKSTWDELEAAKENGTIS
jgi:hypothetical protein